jgi:hypothetical protein
MNEARGVPRREFLWRKVSQVDEWHEGSSPARIVASLGKRANTQAAYSIQRMANGLSLTAICYFHLLYAISCFDAPVKTVV